MLWCGVVCSLVRVGCRPAARQERNAVWDRDSSPSVIHAGSVRSSIKGNWERVGRQ